MKPPPQISVSVVAGKAVINQLVSDEPDQNLVNDGLWVLMGDMTSDSNEIPSMQLMADVQLSEGLLSSQLVSMSADWAGRYDNQTGEVSWSSSSSAGQRTYFEGQICADGMHGHYSSEQDAGQFSLTLQQDAEQKIDRMPADELAKALSASRLTSEGLRERVQSFRVSEDAMRSELNLKELDKENLCEHLKQLKSRAEAAESKIDAERKARKGSEDKSDRLSQLMIGFKLREEALVRQLREKEGVARRAVDAFHGLRAECATLLGAAATAAFDEDGAELEALQSKLSELAKSPPPTTKPGTPGTPAASERLDHVNSRIDEVNDSLDRVRREAESFAQEHSADDE